MKTKNLRFLTVIIFMILILLSGVSCRKDDAAAPPTAPGLDKVATPAFSPVSGHEFVGSVDVTITCATDGATIRYTTNGDTPGETNGIEYSGTPVNITANTTIKAIAYKTGMALSEIGASNYTRAGSVANPTISPVDGSTFSGSQSVTITTTTSGATIKYTLDNSDPKTSGTAISGTAGSSSTSFTINATKTIKAFAFKSGMEDSGVVSATITKIPIATPVITPGSGAFRVYNNEQTVTITTSESGVTIKYTLDNSDPKTSGTAITGTSGTSTLSFNVFGTKTIKAFAFQTGYTDSETATCEYVIARASLPKTGQTTSYAAGDDGALQRGVLWPSPRFTDNGDGTITDHLTGLMWERVPSASTFTWANAFTRVQAVNTAALGGHTDWRLPNRKELMSVVNRIEANSATWLNGQGFSGIQSDLYWSASTCANDTTSAWSMYIQVSGVIGNQAKTFGRYVLAVRSGESGTVSLPKTGQTTSYTTGDDGAIQKGIVWPNPRFTDNGNGTITDNLTGLMWERVPVASTFTWANAFIRITTLNTSALGGYNDWRLPNINELESFINVGEANNITWLNASAQGFSGVQSYYYWSASTFASNTICAWLVTMTHGGTLSYTTKTTNCYVIAVRSGQ